MTRRDFLASGAVAASAGRALAAENTAQRRRPNFVFFLADDLGYADLGCYGARDIRTPHIDRLAREGTRFSNCYANAPVCTPTRVGFLTGRYQQRFGRDMEWPLGPANNKTAGLRPEQAVLPGALKPLGYRTAVHGKWHVGWGEPFRPNSHGWDDFFGILLGNADMYTHRYHDGSLDLWDNGRTVERQGYLTDLLADRAVRWIEQNKDQPFLLYLPFNAVHWPFQAPGRPGSVRTPAGWRDGTREEYARMTEGMDRAVGRVMEALKRHGLDRETLTVFTNDNGGERLSDNSPLAHGKATLFEGGIRVPAVARWPGVIPQGTRTRQCAMTMDFTATFLAAAGAHQTGLDGMDLLPAMQGRGDGMERALFWRIDQPGRKQFAVRKGRWKYIDDNTGNRNFPELLFDAEADPGERRNLFASNQETAAGLRRLAVDWSAEMDRSAKLA